MRAMRATPVVELEVREATASDLDDLVRFTIEEAREAEGRVLDPAAARRGVEAAFWPAPAARYWLVTAGTGGPPLGSASVTVEWSDWNGGYYWWLQSVYVAPEARGRGIFPPLVAAITAAARAAGAVELRLLVHADNGRAVATYRREGFEDLPYLVMRQRL